MLIGLNNRKLGVLRAGAFYSDELEEKPLVRRLVHLVARRISIVGVITSENLDLIMKAYPSLTRKLYFANEYIYEKSYVAFEEYLQAQDLQTDLRSCISALENVKQFLLKQF